MELTPEELKEVLNIFKVETGEYIKALNEGFMVLEENPNNEKNIEDIFRTAHSIKGAARMLGLDVIERVAHELEDTMGLVKNKELTLTGDRVDVLYQAIDSIENTVRVLSKSDNPDLSSIDVTAIVNKLRVLQNKEVLVSEPKVEPKVPEAKTPEAEPDEDSKKEAIDSVRINIGHIDQLMTQAGELINTKIRNEQILNQLVGINNRFTKHIKRFERRNEFIQKLSKLYQDAIDEFSLSLLNETEQRNLIELCLFSDQVLSSAAEDISYLADYHAENTLRTNVLIDELQEQIRQTRLLSLSTIVDRFPRMVRDIAKQMKKKINFNIVGAETKIDKQILEEIKDPLIHIIRNCIDHGIESSDERLVSGKPVEGSILLNIKYEGNSVLIEVKDDGKGLDTQKILDKAVEKNIINKSQLSTLSELDIHNLIFRPGFTTATIITDISGRGVGMDIVRTNVEKLKGVIFVDSKMGAGTSFKIRLPLTLATIQVLIIESVNELYTVPIISIERIVRIAENDIQAIGDRNYIKINEEMILLARMDDVLEKPRRFSYGAKEKVLTNEKRFNMYSAIVIGSAEKKVAFIVDRLHDEQEVVIKNMGKQLKSVNNVMGAAVLGSGELCVVLDPGKLIKSVTATAEVFDFLKSKQENVQKKRILVVDDSITTRTLEKNILEQAGYDVSVAVNGVDAWNLLNEKTNFDLLVSDVEMPMMNGYELVKKIKASSRLKYLPCILCTSLNKEKDREKGIASGADAYLSKGTFDQGNLLNTIKQMV